MAIKRLQSTGGITSVTNTDSPSIDLSGNGTATTPLTASAKISATAGNALTINPDGLFVPASTGGSSPALKNSIWYDSKTSGNFAEDLSQKARNSNATRFSGWKWDFNYGTIPLPFALSTLADPSLHWLIDVTFHVLFLTPTGGLPTPYTLQARPKVNYSTDTIFGNDTEVSVPVYEGITQSDVSGIGKWVMTDQSATNFPLGAEFFLYQRDIDPVFTQTVEIFDIGINYTVQIAKKLT